MEFGGRFEQCGNKNESNQINRIVNINIVGLVEKQKTGQTIIEQCEKYGTGKVSHYIEHWTPFGQTQFSVQVKFSEPNKQQGTI